MDKDNFRIYLRSLEPNDYIKTHSWRKNPDYIHGVLSVKRFVSLDTEKRWVENSIKEHENLKAAKFAVVLKTTDELVGLVYLKSIDFINKNASEGIIIGENKGKGIGTEARILNLHYAFCDLGLERVTSRILEDNYPSIKSAINAGFVKEGLLRSAIYKDGGFKNVVVFSILKDEFFKKYVNHSRD
jgi:RimJ/RimL family protein N-acetyltransferase